MAACTRAAKKKTLCRKIALRALNKVVCAVGVKRGRESENKRSGEWEKSRAGQIFSCVRTRAAYLKRRPDSPSRRKIDVDSFHKGIQYAFTSTLSLHHILNQGTHAQWNRKFQSWTLEMDYSKFQSSVSWRWPKDTWALGKRLSTVLPPSWIFQAVDDWREKESSTEGVNDRQEEGCRKVVTLTRPNRMPALQARRKKNPNLSDCACFSPPLTSAAVLERLFLVSTWLLIAISDYIKTPSTSSTSTTVTG